nr:DNA-directed RNA polymerase, mitochondrial-like isoform X1 [Procambarus clarkii]
MAQGVCFLRFLQPSTCGIPLTGPRVTARGRGQLRALPGGCTPHNGGRDWRIHRFSTQMNAQFPKSQPKGRIKNKSTVDIIRVADESISEGKALVTHINQHSFSKTLERIPKLPTTAQVPQSVEDCFLTQNLLELSEPVVSEKFKALISSHNESSWTGYPTIQEEVRWDRNMPHTYDASFLLNDVVSENTEMLELKSSDINFSEKLFKNDAPLEGNASSGLPSTDISLLSHPLNGFAQVGIVPFPRTSDGDLVNGAHVPVQEEAAVSSVKTKKKELSSKKKAVSSKKKTKSAAVVHKKSVSSKLKEVKATSSNTSKSKKKHSPTKVLSNEHLLEETETEAHEPDVEGSLPPILGNESVSASSTLPKKIVKKTKKVKQQQETLLKEARRKGREESFNQSLTAYVSICISLGMLNRAIHTLLYYRNCSKQRKFASQKINSIHPYNAVLLGYAEKGNFKRMEEILKWLDEDNIVPNETTFAALLNCLGQEPESPTNTNNINGCFSTMEKAGIDIQALFEKVEFVRDGHESTLRAIQRVIPSFKPKQETFPAGFRCNLVNELNTSLYSTKVTSPAEGAVTEDQLAAWAEEQFALEVKSELVIDSIEKKMNAEDTQYYREMLEFWEDKWRKVLHQTLVTQLNALKKCFFANRLDKRMTLYPYLISIPPEEFVSIMMQEIYRLARGSETFSFSKYALYRRLGENVYNRYLVKYKRDTGVLDKLKRVYKNYLSWYFDSNRKDGVTYNPRVCWQELCLKEGGLDVEHSPVEWPNTVMVSLGKFMYSLILLKVMVWNPLQSKKHAYPAVYEVERTKGYRVVDEIKPSPSLVELYQKAAKPILTFESVCSPMVCPPIPWVSTKLGGYLINNAKIVRLPFNAYQQRQRMEECGNQQLYPLMDSLNQLSTIPWKINKPVLDIIIELFNNKGSVELDIPQPLSECPEPEKIHDDMTSAEVHKIRRQHLEYDQKKSEMHSLWCDALYKLSLAHHFRDRVFWFPHNMDFRGRVYPCPPHLNHLGSDVFRSVLQFAKGEKLGPHGLKWLKLHLINLTGFVKRETVEDRLKYCENVIEDILDSADNPLTGRRWWTESDEPWQTLAACKELAAAIRSDNQEEYVSYLPVHQDGSCNGLQHYAALGRDKIGAVSVNLAPSKVPQDVYSAVAVLVENERIKDADAGNEVAQALEGHVHRKVIKQTVMTTVYGVTRFGARLQIDKQLKDLDEFPQQLRWAASHYLVQKVFLCLEKMFTATKDIQNWFTDCARLVTETRGENLEYVTPLGLPVVQPYSKLRTDTASVTKLATSFSMDSYMKPNVMKQKNAFPPNFIHSLDSSHMMLTSLYCQQAGITFVSVHDCFWTHASTVDIMSKICREQFVALHQEPILEDLSKFLQKTFGLSHSDFSHDGSALDSSKMKLNTIVAQVPPKGEFDITSVHKSIYFFS